MEVRLLGPVQVHQDDGAWHEISAGKQRWLLAFLALEPGRVRSVESIIDALWPDDPPKTAPNLVQGYVSDLRRLMGTEAIQTSGAGYRLSVRSDDVDVGRFQDALGRARAVAGDRPDDALELLEDGLATWTGVPFGAPAPDGALAAAATMLDGLRLDAEELRARCELECGRHQGLVPRLEELVRAHPYREQLWVTLAVSLYRSGRQADALRRLRDARSVLEEDLGLSPGRELSDIEARILNHDPTLDAPAPETSTRLETLIGRQDEVARLTDRLRQASNGTQYTVFIGGEPGIGKTRLTHEVGRQAASRGVTVLTGRCDEHVAVPYRPFIEALTDHLLQLDPEARRALVAPRLPAVHTVLPLVADDLGRALDSSSAERRDLTLLERFDTFCWLLRRVQQDGTLVVVLDDIHWADSATLRLLHYLTAGGRLPRSVTLATYRTTEPAELLDDILADLRTSPLAERLTLHGLGIGELRLLIQEQDGPDDIAAWVHEQTGGNPFLATEIMRHIAETGSSAGVPQGVSEVVGQRLRRLSPPARRLLERASIIGDSAPVAILRHVTQEPGNLSAALAELTRRGILQEDESAPGHYSFTHAILRTAATSLMTSIEREDLHLAAAAAWRKLPVSSESTLAVASHYLAAGPIAPTDEAIDAFLQAGHDADLAGAKVEASRWFDRALQLVSEDDPRHRAIRLTRFVAAQAAWHWLHGDHLTQTTADTGAD